MSELIAKQADRLDEIAKKDKKKQKKVKDGNKVKKFKLSKMWYFLGKYGIKIKI